MFTRPIKGQSSASRLRGSSRGGQASPWRGVEALESRLLLDGVQGAEPDVLVMAAAVNYTPYQYLQMETSLPRFAPDETMIPLTRWGWQVPLDASTELAERWGYAMQLSNATQSYVNGLDNPASDISQRVAYAAADPENRTIGVLINRPMHDAAFQATLPPETWLRDANGNYILDTNGKKVWSPEAPDSVFEQVGALAAAPLAKIISKANGAKLVLLNGGEYGLNVYGWNGAYLVQDPVVVAAKGETDWFTYVSREKARQEKLISAAIRAAAPESVREAYVHYFDDGALDRGVYGSYWQWVFDYQQMQGNSDLPNNSLYFKEFNTGWSGTRDLLSQQMGSVAQHQALGEDLAYNWVCSGWKDNPGFSDDAHYMGFLKSLYVAGMVGGIAGYFTYPTGGFGVATPTLPNWLQQMMTLGQAQALFSHVEGYLRDGTLLPGPDMHRWSTDLPAYEFPTGDANLRVIARKHNDRDQWIISAWAADDLGDRAATVTIPTLGAVTLQARAAGSVYLATLVDGVVTLDLLDTDGMHPTADLNIINIAAGAHGAANLPGDRVVRTGGDLTIHFTPDPGHTLLDVIVDGVSVGPLASYEFTGVNTNHTIVASFSAVPVNLPPTITDLGDLTLDEDTTSGPIPLTIGDLITPVGDLILTASSSNPDLLPDGRITLGGSGADRTISLAPLANASGSATVTLTVRDTGSDGIANNDDDAIASDTFVLTVTPVNDAPVVADQSFAVDEGSAGGSAVGAVAASDPDVGDTLTYSIESGNIDDAFAIDPATGQISVANSAAIDFATNPAFTLTVRVADSALPSLAHSAIVTINVLPSPPPTVANVVVRGSAWMGGFTAFLAAQGLGSADGYFLPAGSGAQLAPLPWTNINQIVLVFSEAVTVGQNDLILRGVNQPAYAFADFATGAAADGRFAATWTLASAIGVDKLLLSLSDNVVNTAGRRLDGEWTNPASRATPAGGSSAFNSGDGAPGGAFGFRFNVAPGDANQNGGTNIQDVVVVRNRQGSSTANAANYSIFGDVNANGGINVQDVILTRNQQGKSLPAGEPALPASAGPAFVVLASALAAPTLAAQGPLPAPAVSPSGATTGWTLRPAQGSEGVAAAADWLLRLRRHAKALAGAGKLALRVVDDTTPLGLLQNPS